MPVFCRSSGDSGSGSGGGKPCAGDGGDGKRSGSLLLVLDEGHHLPDVARDALEMSAEITAPWYRLQLDLFTKLVATCMEQFRPKTIPPLAIPERLNAHCEELYELIASLNNILNLYMPAGQEAEHRFAMGELPDEVLEICQRLAKLTEMLRGLAELLLNDLSEKTGSHDIVRLHRLIFADEPRVGDVRGAKQTLAAGVSGAIFRCAGDQMGDAGKARRTACISGFTAWEYVSAISWKGCCGAVFRTLLSPPQPCVR